MDTISPTIELISPEDNYVKRTKKSSKEITFRFKVTDESEIKSCSLIVDGEVMETKTNVQKDVENVFSIRLRRGSYDWQIKCIDSEGNEGFSEVRDLRIKKKKSSSNDNSLPSNVYYEEIETTSSTNNIQEMQEQEPEVIVLKFQKKEKYVFEKVGEWIVDLFESFVGLFG